MRPNWPRLDFGFAALSRRLEDLGLLLTMLELGQGETGSARLATLAGGFPVAIRGGCPVDLDASIERARRVLAAVQNGAALAARAGVC